MPAFSYELIKPECTVLNENLSQKEKLGDKTVTKQCALCGSSRILGTHKEASKWNIQQALLPQGYWTSFLPNKSWLKGYTKDLELPL